MNLIILSYPTICKTINLSIHLSFNFPICIFYSITKLSDVPRDRVVACQTKQSYIFDGAFMRKPKLPFAQDIELCIYLSIFNTVYNCLLHMHLSIYLSIYA